MNEDKKMSFSQKISNIWYHFKWPILVVCAFLIIIAVALLQSFSKISPDAMIMYASTRALTVDTYNSFEESIYGVLKNDYNGDGHKKIDILQITFNMYDEDSEDDKYFFNAPEQSQMKQRLDIELSMGASVIYIMDKDLYKGIKDLMIAPLEEVLGYIPSQSEDGYCVEISKLPIYQKTSFNNIPSDNVICVRTRRDSGILKSNDSVAYYNNNLSVFKDIVEYK